MFKAISRELVTVDKKMAENLDRLNTYGGQRPIREKHLRLLEAKLAEGLFTTGHIAMAKLKFNGNQTVMMDGQHQIKLVLKTGKPIAAVLEKFDVSDAQEASLLFRQFNSDARRSLNDKVRAEAFSLGVDWPSKLTRLVVSGAAIHSGKANATDDRKVELLKEYLNFGTFLKEIFTSEKSHLIKADHLFRAAVVHAIICSWEKSKEDARRFWLDVRDGENLKRGMPSYKLRDYLMTTSVSIGRGASKGAAFKIASTHEMTSKCITAWNAYRRNESTDLKYFVNKTIPKAI